MKKLGLLPRNYRVSKGLRELVRDVCLLRVLRAAVQGPRGGGKSQGCSFIEFYLNAILDFEALNMGGSEQQAFAVYRYLQRYIKSSKFWMAWYTVIQQSRTETKIGAWIAVLTASSRSIRSPHAGGLRPAPNSGVDMSDLLDEMTPKEAEEYLNEHEIPMRDVGGCLVFDEEVEAEPEIVKGVLPTVNTARPSVILRLSTFHRTDGTYGELIDNHKEMGYNLYKWDIFDVAEKCTYNCDECPGGKDFSEDVFHTVVNEATGEEEVQLKHRAYCGVKKVDGTWEGKAHYSEGWVPMEEIFQAWRESHMDSDWFEVEFMGWKPSQAGKVFKDAFMLQKSWRPTSYVTGHPCTITIDWGFKSECCVQVWQEQPGGRKVLLECETYTQTRDTYIYEVVKAFGIKYNTRDVRGDSSHPFCNANLASDPRYRMNVVEVIFQSHKEAAAGAWNNYIERDLCDMDPRFKQMHDRLKNWSRGPDGKIKKGDDHEGDAGLCFFSKFAEGNVLTSKRAIRPMTWKTATRGHGAGIPRAVTNVGRRSSR